MINATTNECECKQHFAFIPSKLIAVPEWHIVSCSK